MSPRERVLCRLGPVHPFKSPVFVVPLRRAPFGKVGELSPCPLDLAQGPLTKVVVSRFQRHSQTFSLLDTFSEKL